MLRSVAMAMAVLLATSVASAKPWAEKMFETRTHDFGHVARGAKAEFAFEIQNLYEEEVHIADVKTSCGCTTPTVTKNTLKTWEKGAIVATLNTRSFVGPRTSTLTVVIDKPFYAEVALNISGTIHSDVDFQPGAVALGQIEEGVGAEQEVLVTYRGRAPWQINDVRSASNHLEVELSEPLKQPGLITYKMLVRLKADAPPGLLNEQLTVVTSDKSMPAISLPVEGRVAPPLSVSPSPVLFGTLSPGQTATKQLVITGKQPFKLLAIASEPVGLQFRAVEGLVKKVHLVPVTITAPEQTGELTFSITIETDLPQGGKATCQARATIGNGGPLEAKTAETGGALTPR
jgi:Protein of unknown function (DUF1573)